MARASMTQIIVIAAERGYTEDKKGMDDMATYNGWQNRNTWNQALWLSNDEGLYRLARDHKRRARTLDIAAANLLTDLQDMGSTHTPDGIRWTKTGIRAGLSDL